MALPKPFVTNVIVKQQRSLQTCLRNMVESANVLTDRDEVVIQKSFDKAIQESMISYFLVHAHIREQFVATLTHDLRNPIGAVKMASELIEVLAQEAASANQLSDILDLSKRISKNAKRADRMIQDMLDASVVQVGERPAVSGCAFILKIVQKDSTAGPD